MIKGVILSIFFFLGRRIFHAHGEHSFVFDDTELEVANFDVAEVATLGEDLFGAFDEVFAVLRQFDDVEDDFLVGLLGLCRKQDPGGSDAGGTVAGFDKLDVEVSVYGYEFHRFLFALLVLELLPFLFCGCLFGFLGFCLFECKVCDVAVPS